MLKEIRVGSNKFNPIQGGGKNACATYFGHISSTEARIFMEFETYAHKIVLDHQLNFHKDPCKDASHCLTPS